MTLLVACALAGSASAVRYPPDYEQDIPLENRYGVTPIQDGWEYTPIVTTPPITNPSPSPVLIGHEIISVPYTDAYGALYDVQANLTTAVVKVFRGGQLMGQATMTASDVILFRQSAQYGDIVNPEFWPIVAGIVTGIVLLAIDWAQTGYQNNLQCDRQAQSAMISAAQQMQACLASGGRPHYTPAQPNACGVGTSVSCQPGD